MNSRPRRTVAHLVLTLAGVVASWLASCGDATIDGHNVLLISIDTMRPDYLGAYGYDRGVSPRIDRVAEQGVVFEDVTSASPWTLPSHATMLSGMYPSTHGVENHEYQLTEETLATWLQAVGYQTFAVVNTHNIGFPDYGLMRGFDEPDWITEMELDADGRPIQGGKILNRAELIIKRGIKHMTERDPSRPFFLFLHFYDVHTDFTPEPKWEREYVDPYRGVMKPITMEIHKKRNRMQEGKFVPEPADIRYLEQMYDAEIRTFDERLGVLFDYLDTSGLSEDTVVAITSDHGEEYNEHGGLLHGRTHYQELIRIPLILRGPGVPVRQRVDLPIHLVDVAPTLFGLAGIPFPPGMDGYDVSLAWSDPEQLPRLRYLFSEADHNNLVDGYTVHNLRRMVRLEDTVLHYNVKTEKKELYDLSTDPWEQNDLSEQDPERTRLLFDKLQEFLAREGSAKRIGEPSAETQELLNQLGYGGEDEDEDEEPQADDAQAEDAQAEDAQAEDAQAEEAQALESESPR